MRFLMLAFCDPSLGTDPNHVDTIKNPRSSFVGHQFNRQSIAPKVVPMVEPLFKNHCHTTMAADAHGALVPIPFSKTEMFESDNVLGYRVWFFVSDPTLDLTNAIVTRIQKNNIEMGNDNEYLSVSENDPRMRELLDTFFKGDGVKLVNFVSRLNNGAKKANAENAKNRQQFA